MKRILRLYNTLRYLKLLQIRFQLWYRIRRYWQKIVGFRYSLSLDKDATQLKFTPWIDKPVSFRDNTFTFLNQTINYFSEGNNERVINWNEKRYGRLWAYNLNYMDYLLQPSMRKSEGLNLIREFIKDLPDNPTGIEPYPLSIRAVNWIKFLSGYQENASITSELLSKFNASLYAQFQILLKNLEYHLLGNHILENGFSLLFGAYYFSDYKLYRKAVKIIRSELDEQILDDGGHFELSPMYHQIILDRLLDCINLLQNNKIHDTQEQLQDFMKNKAAKMISWINTLTFSNGDIPMFNDSAFKIAPVTSQLNDYSKRLGLNNQGLFEQSALTESGYRRFDGENYECILDIDGINPPYQPGHAHADTFSFVLYTENVPCIIDTGISTYETGTVRTNERQTFSHNTVTVGDESSSDVWSSFRVGKRAAVKIIRDERNSIIAEHNGFRKFNTVHQREWLFKNRSIVITDKLSNSLQGKAHFLLGAGEFKSIENQVIKLMSCTLSFENAQQIDIQVHKIPLGYNMYQETYKIEVSFQNYIKTKIQL